MKRSAALPLHVLAALLAVLLIPTVSSAETLTVQNIQGGTLPGTLRRAVIDAEDGDTIVFRQLLDGSTIHLEYTMFVENKNLTFDASSLTNGITISGDSNDDGVGDFRVFDLSLGANVTMRALTILDGKADDGTGSGAGRGGLGGGAIYCNQSTLTLEQCTLSGNSAGNGSVDDGGGGGGGAISLFGGTLTMRQCTLADNRAGDGVGFYLAGRGGAIQAITSTVNLEQCTFAHNQGGESAVGGGDGGAIRANGGTVTLEQCTFALNRAVGDGGGIFNDGGSSTVSITDSIIAGNIADGGEGPDLNTDANTTGDGINVIGNNTLVGGLASAAFPAGPTVGTGAAALDARLAPLADNGGRTETLLPLRGSPALNPAGGAAASAFPADQRGFDRIVANVLDAGAVEAPDYARIDAEIAAANAVAAANARAARQADLSGKLKKLKKKLKNAKRKGQATKVKKYKKQIKKLKKKIRAL